MFPIYSVSFIFVPIFPLDEDRELEYDEFPLEVQYMWPDHAACRMELRQRHAQGGSVKVSL